MVVIFHIERIEAGVYQTVVTDGHNERIGEAVAFESIEHAIRDSANDFEGAFHFAEVHYGGMSSGTFVLGSLRQQAGEVAARLVELNAMAKHIQGF